ncbi:hypothetical protein L1276_003682 [Flavobacterium sp. HSC-32F16]|nr:hypothetical protein [Flavobacterium sp. HSC-32F16]
MSQKNFIYRKDLKAISASRSQSEEFESFLHGKLDKFKISVQ